MCYHHAKFNQKERYDLIQLNKRIVDFNSIRQNIQYNFLSMDLELFQLIISFRFIRELFYFKYHNVQFQKVITIEIFRLTYSKIKNIFKIFHLHISHVQKRILFSRYSVCIFRKAFRKVITHNTQCDGTCFLKHEANNKRQRTDSTNFLNMQFDQMTIEEVDILFYFST